MAGFRYNYTYVTSKQHNFITSLVMNIFPNAQQQIPLIWNRTTYGIFKTILKPLCDAASPAFG